MLGAAYSGMSDVIKGTQFDPAIPQDARIAENFLKPVNLFGARYSHYPCVGGVYAVFRLIKDDSEDIPTFEELGYMPQPRQSGECYNARKELSFYPALQDPVSQRL